MATITVNQFNDDGTTARSAGEVLTVNGGVFTWRTDTRWHATAPASMTGTMGGASVISATLGGGIVVDARNVRWLAFTGGSGTVPAIGTSITQGGVSGYLLAVYANLTSAPTAVAAAMPATGFLKFREVTSGPFTAGALTGITATASGADVTGWLEIVADQSANFSVPRLGNFTTRGDWFYLDNTTGAAQQILQVPTNGGGVNTYIPGVWIETGVGTNAYEYWPGLLTSTNYTAGALGTDARCKFVRVLGTGQVQIGWDSTSNAGFVPPSGCKVRVPNVFLRQCTTGARATNAVPHATIATRPDFTTTNAGVIDMEFTCGDWYLLFSQPYSVKLHHCASFDAVNIAECATALDLNDGGTGMASALDIRALTLTSNFAGGTITDWRSDRGNTPGTSDHSLEVSFCIGQTFTRVQAGILGYARSSGQPWYINQSSDLVLNQCRSFNGGVLLATAINCVLNQHDHVDRYLGTTNATTPYYAIQATVSCQDITVNGMTFGLAGAIANCQPYSGLVSAASSTGIDVRNIGTRTTFLNGGSANQPAYIFGDLGNNLNVRLQRCYVAPTRTGAILSLNSTKNLLCESVYGDFADALTQAGLNQTVKGCGATQGVAGQASVYGTHFCDTFTSDTLGRVVLQCCEPTTETLGLVTTNFSAGSGFTSAGGVSLATLNDSLIVEMGWFAKGHTAFRNTAATITATNSGNHSFEYALDTGAGYGAWKTINGANLSAESISPSTGFKLKFRITCTTAAASNLVSFIRIDTDSTLVAQTDNLYPLDTFTLSLTGLVAGSDVVVLAAGTETELVNVDAWGTSTYPFVYETPSTVDIGVFKAGYVPFYIRSYPLASSNATLPIAQTIDRAYLS